MQFTGLTAGILLALSILILPARATAGNAESVVEFTPDYLADEVNLEQGKVLWEKQCRHCHGSAAYPGKAPKLKPYIYKPEFVYKRVSDGFRKMPAWKDVFSQEERMAIVAYVMSNQFAP